MTIVLAAGNTGYKESTGKSSSTTSDWVPTQLIDVNSPVILVGATYHDGSLAELSTPASGDVVISMYAQGVKVSTPMANTVDYYTYFDGTSLAAPQVVSSLLIPSSFFCQAERLICFGGSRLDSQRICWRMNGPPVKILSAYLIMPLPLGDAW